MLGALGTIGQGYQLISGHHAPDGYSKLDCKTLETPILLVIRRLIDTKHWALLVRGDLEAL